MQSEPQIDDLGFCPSFNCYSSDSPPSAAVKISRQLQLEQPDQFHVDDDDEFEFSLMIGDEELLPEDIDSDCRTVFPLFNRDLLISNDLDREIDRTTSLQNLFITDHETGEESDCTTSLEKLFITEREEVASPSSSESDESDGEAPAVFCVWRHKNDVGASPQCKKSRSTGSGSGSKRWRIRDLLRRSNSEGKEPMVMLSHKKVVEIPKRKVNSGEFAGKMKPSSPSVHEVFYVQQRAKREVVKRKSYLPYREGLVGFFSNGNSNSNGNSRNGKGKGKKLTVSY